MKNSSQFEEEPCEFVVGRKYRLAKDDDHKEYPHLVGSILTLASKSHPSVYDFIDESWRQIELCVKCEGFPNAVLEPIPDEQEEDEDISKETVAAEAYQVIGALAEEGGLSNKPGVQKALDYFGDIANGDTPTRVKKILPWTIEGTG